MMKRKHYVQVAPVIATQMAKRATDLTAFVKERTNGIELWKPNVAHANQSDCVKIPSD